MFDKIFDKEPCNTGRQLEIDLSKTGMLLELVLCHAFILCSSDERLLSGIPYLMDSVIGGPLGAPGFMIAMGIGMIYTRHNTPKDFAKRGVILGVLSLVLNLCRFTIPYLIGYLITGDSEKYLSCLVYMTFENDILMFASLSFLLMALLRHLDLKPFVILAIGFAMSIAATLLNGIDFGNDVLNIIFGCFIGTEDAAGNVCSYFTLFNWFVIVAFGYVYGHYYTRVKDKTRFHLVFDIPALILTIIFLSTRMTARAGVFGEGQLCYYHITTIDILGALAAGVARMGVFYVLSLFVPDIIKRFGKEAASNVTSVYSIQWVLIVVIADLVLYISRGTSELTDIQIIILALCILTVSLILAHFYKSFKRSRRELNEKKTQSVV